MRDLGEEVDILVRVETRHDLGSGTFGTLQAEEGDAVIQRRREKE